MFWTIFSLIIIFALLFLGYFAAHRYKGRIGYSSGGKHLKICDRIFLSPDKQIVIIKFANRVILTGVTKDNMINLGEFSEDVLSEIDEEYVSTGSFNDILQFFNKDKKDEERSIEYLNDSIRTRTENLRRGQKK